MAPFPGIGWPPRRRESDVTDPSDVTEARELLDRIRADLGEVDRRIRRHPYPAAFERREAELDALVPFVATEYYIAQSDLRSFAGMTQRFGERPDVRGFFAGIYQGEAAAVEGLFRLAERIGLTVEWLDAYEVAPEGFGYAAYVAWSAQYGSAAEVAAALLVNFGAWGENCRRLRDALRAGYGLETEDTLYLDTFADLPPFEAEAREIVQRGLDRGVPRRKIHRAARLFQGYEEMFWDAMARLADI